jgi:hypothetical protein
MNLVTLFQSEMLVRAGSVCPNVGYAETRAQIPRGGCVFVLLLVQPSADPVQASAQLLRCHHKQETQRISRCQQVEKIKEGSGSR